MAPSCEIEKKEEVEEEEISFCRIKCFKANKEKLFDLNISMPKETSRITFGVLGILTLVFFPRLLLIPVGIFALLTYVVATVLHPVLHIFAIMFGCVPYLSNFLWMVSPFVVLYSLYDISCKLKTHYSTRQNM